MGLSSLKIKKVIIFSQKKLLFYFGKRKFLEKPIIFQEGTFRARKIKKNHYEKISCISKNGTF